MCLSLFFAKLVLQIIQRDTQRLSQCLECFDSALALAGLNLAQIGFADSCFGSQHILRETGMPAPGFDGMCTGEHGADNGGWHTKTIISRFGLVIKRFIVKVFKQGLPQRQNLSIGFLPSHP